MVAAIVGLFISVVSLSTCVTFSRNVFIMSCYIEPRAAELVCYRIRRGRAMNAKSNRLIGY